MLGLLSNFRGTRLLIIMIRLLVFFLFAAAIASGQESGTGNIQNHVVRIDKRELELLWHDEFDGKSLDTTKWEYRQLGKRRDAYNVKEAVSVKKGKLYINTWSENQADGEKKFCTGMIGSEGKLAIRKGYFEARIKFNDKPGMWSAFWLQSPTFGKINGKPEESGVEIDIMEHRVNDKDGNDVKNLVASNLHFGFGLESRPFTKMTEDAGKGYHIYGMKWDDDQYIFYFDGILYYRAVKADSVEISKVPEYIILSSEVQDNGWAGKISPGGFGNLQENQTKMIVDWVRVYVQKNVATKSNSGK
jgi:beta-glucanase (GH16 family)